jgi:DNA-binding response OmpR family regulator
VEASQPGQLSSTDPFPPASPIILLVDDDPAVLESLRRVLVTEGWQVVTAASGEEALARLAEQQPDLMITDLCMIGVNGWDLLFHEKLERPSLPIFVITALPLSSVGGADRFATGFFQKPLDLDALVAAIRRRLQSLKLSSTAC